MKWFQVTLCTCKLTPSKLALTLNPSNMILKGKNHYTGCKTSKRLGKTRYEAFSNQISFKEKVLGQLWGMEVGASLLGREFESAQVNPLPYEVKLLSMKRIISWQTGKNNWVWVVVNFIHIQKLFKLGDVLSQVLFLAGDVLSEHQKNIVILTVRSD